MKTILIPTDFSENSMKAIEFAADYFNQKETQLVLCNVYDIPVGGASRMFTFMEQLRKQAERDMEALVTQLNSLHKEKEFTIKSQVLQGHFEVQLKALAYQLSADFIVIGTKGSSGIKDVLIGSNAAYLLKTIDLPVFAIPADYSKDMINEITFSYDGNAIQKQDVQLMLDFSIVNNLAIQLLHVRIGDDSPIQNWSAIENMFQDKSISLHEEAAKNYEDGLKNGLENLKTILVLVRRKKTFWEKLINDSNTQKVVKHFQLPILVLPEKK